MGAYSRLFVPISLLIVAVVAVRYTLLVDSEAAQARHQLVLETRQVTQNLAEALVPLAAAHDRAAITALLQRTANVSEGVARVRWLEGGTALEAMRLPDAPLYPSWFPAVAGIDPLTYTVPVGASGAHVEIWFSATPR